MAKDYAKHTRYKYVPERSTYQRIRLWVWFSVCFLAVICILANIIVERKSIYAVTQRPGIQAFGAKLAALVHHKKDPANAKLAKNASQVTETPAVHFDFYTELPNMQMALGTLAEADKTPKILPPAVSSAAAVPAVAPVVAKNTAAATSANKQYMIQVGTYASSANASQMRISLLLAGFDASVVKVKIGAKDQYRVQRGPYPKMASAKAAQQALIKQGIDSEITELS